LRTGHEKTIHPPSRCPMCGTPLKREEGAVALLCPNKGCFARNLAGLKHFVARNAMDIEGLGEKTIEQFMNEGLVRDPADLYELAVGDILPLERFAETSAQNIVEAIASSRRPALGRFVYALGIEHVGEETARDLAEHFGTLAMLRQASAEELREVDGIGEVVAASVADWFRETQHIHYLDRLLKHVEPLSARKPPAGRLAGQTFVFTGELEAMSREEAKEKIRALGAKASESVSSKTTAVVAGKGEGSAALATGKLDKAKKLKVRVLNEKEFLDIIGK